MDKKTIQRNLEDLVLILHRPNERSGVLCKALPKKNLLTIDQQIEQTLEYLRLCLADRMLTIESLEREYAELKRRKG